MVLAFFCLIATLAFVAFSIDTGNIALHKTLMQNAVDSAALAAAMEITNAVENAPQDAEDPTAYARDLARAKAFEVAGLNGVFIDENVDVTFGLRSYDPSSEKFEITWGVEPANAVKVVARKDNDNRSAPDAKLPMIFAGILGDDTVRMRSEAIAYIESRDIAVVLDFSGSMAYDSLFLADSVEKLGADAIRDNLREIFWDLDLPDSALGTLDQEEPTSSGSARTSEVKYLKVKNSPSGDEPTISATFKYNAVDISSTKPYKKVKLNYSGSSTTHSSLNASSGTYTGTGGNSSKDITSVEVTVTMPGSGSVTKSASMTGGSTNPTATITVNEAGSQATVSINSSKISQIKVWYTNGDTDTWTYSSGTSKTVNGDSGKTIEDVQVWSASGATKKINDFDVYTSWDYTATLTDSNANVKSYFKLNGLSYPYPSGSWDDYINYVRSDAEINRGGHREMYGGITFAHYLMESRPSHAQTPALSKTQHYPFHAVRAGNDLFVDFLSNLGFGDHVGLVSYDQARRTESVLNEDGQSIDISADPLDSHYNAIKTIMQYKQAGNYAQYTNIGGGIREARDLLAAHGRQGARPTILLMTDGNANTYDNEAGQNSRDAGFAADSFWDVPAGFDWSAFDDVNTTQQPFNVGSSSAEDKARRYALSQAHKAVEDGYTIHTLAVGAGADRDLLKAIAHLGGGEYISVEGDLSVADLISEVQDGFYRIAALVPPARLADPDEVSP